MQSIKRIVRQDWWQGFLFVCIRNLLERLIPFHPTDSIWDILYRQFNNYVNNFILGNLRPTHRERDLEGETHQFLEQHHSQMGFPSQRQFMRGTGFFVVVGWFFCDAGLFKVWTREKKKINWNSFSEMQYTELGNKDALYGTNLHHGSILSGGVTCIVNQEYY